MFLYYLALNWFLITILGALAVTLKTNRWAFLVWIPSLLMSGVGTLVFLKGCRLLWRASDESGPEGGAMGFGGIVVCALFLLAPIWLYATIRAFPRGAGRNKTALAVSILLWTTITAGLCYFEDPFELLHWTE